MKLLRAALATLLLSSITAACESAECLGGMRAALVEGHFTGPLVCSTKDATFLLVAKGVDGNGYSIYDYRYRYRPPQGSVMHGGQKIVVFRNGKYLGQYSLSPPPYVDMLVKGQILWLQVDGNEDLKVDLSAELPSSINIDGDNVRLSK